MPTPTRGECHDEFLDGSNLNKRTLSTEHYRPERVVGHEEKPRVSMVHGCVVNAGLCFGSTHSDRAMGPPIIMHET